MFKSDNPFPFRTMKSQGVRALNKPITILWLTGQYYLFKKTEFFFSDLEETVGGIINDYTGNPNVIDPFWRLKHDGILDFPDEQNLTITNSGVPSKSDFRKKGRAVFSAAFKEYISDQRQLVSYCESILNSYFTESLEEDILYRTGLDYRQNFLQPVSGKMKRKRDPRFRKSVAVAYNHQCAVCGFNLMLGGQSIANEAAHIKWHAYEGPDSVANGLLLCNLHHNLFDRGVFTFSEGYKMQVSDKVSSYSDGFKRWLLDYKGREIVMPRKEEWVPGQEFLGWHRGNVFIA